MHHHHLCMAAGDNGHEQLRAGLPAASLAKDRIALHCHNQISSKQAQSSKQLTHARTHQHALWVPLSAAGRVPAFTQDTGHGRDTRSFLEQYNNTACARAAKQRPRPIFVYTTTLLLWRSWGNGSCPALLLDCSNYISISICTTTQPCPHSLPPLERSI